jgi:4-hydroxy-2-oxoheptanedioate aldolase
MSSCCLCSSDGVQEIARRIVKTSKFAPRGTRGCGSPFTHQVFGVAEGKYEVTCDDNLLVIVQIESQDGIDNVKEIAATEGVDILFVGMSMTPSKYVYS